MTKSEGPKFAPSGIPKRSGAAPFQVVTLDEAKKRCDVPTAVAIHDGELADLIAEATEHVELDMSLIGATGPFLWNLPTFPKDYIALPFRNVTGVDEIKYDDAAGDEQTLTDFQFVESATRPTIWAAPESVFPETQHDKQEAVRLVFTGGYSSAPTVGPRFKQAVLCRVRILFAREDFTSETWRTYESIVNADRSKYP